MVNVKQQCQKCSATDYLSTVDGNRVCAKCAADAFWARMPSPMKHSLNAIHGPPESDRSCDKLDADMQEVLRRDRRRNYLFGTLTDD